jgi:hypothetical protein
MLTIKVRSCQTFELKQDKDGPNRCHRYSIDIQQLCSTAQDARVLAQCRRRVSSDRQPRMQLADLQRSSPYIGFSYSMLVGSHSAAERQSSVDSFQRGEAFVFLISSWSDLPQPGNERVYTDMPYPLGTLAGGVGLNLTAVSRGAVVRWRRDACS